MHAVDMGSSHVLIVGNNTLSADMDQPLPQSKALR